MEQARAGGVSGELENQMFLVAMALQNLDPSVRREYDEAVQNASSLVANESKFLDFLRTDNMDPDKAAVRIAMYWKYRKHIFEDRWLLPMTQTGHGALSEQDILYLRTGYTTPIERPSGGPLCLVDMSRVPQFVPGRTNTRIVFYFATVMTDEGFQLDGLTIVQIVTSAPRPAVDTDPEGWKMFREALPLRVKRLIVAQSYEQWKDALIDWLGYQVSLSAGFKTRHHPYLIRGDSIASVAGQMQTMGIDRRYIPRSHGGEFDYSAFADWTRMRLSLEDIMGSAPLGNNMTFARQLPAQEQPHALRAVVPAQQAVGKRQGKRAIRKKQQRKRPRAPRLAPEQPAAFSRPYLGVMTLAEERQVWDKLNRQVREDNRRLESLLAQARWLVARYSSGER